MNIVRKMISFIKNIFIKQNAVNRLAELKIDTEKNNNENFIQYLKQNTTETKPKKKVETLTCAGSGLGIQKKITY